MFLDVSPVLILTVVILLYLFSCIHILKEYERAVVFRLGKLMPSARAPG
jgi:regulator of protease activity HflC (stomatin/prohibitin superfamily)